MKFQQYLIEGKITPKEKKELTQAIVKEKPGDLKIGKEQVKVEKKNSELLFTYDKKLWELTASLVDICDAMGLTFKETNKTNQTEFQIKV